MSYVTNLSDDFDEKFAAITTRLREELTLHEYGHLVHDFKEKKLANATRHLEYVTKKRDKAMSMTRLASMQNYADTWHEFYRNVRDALADHELFTNIMDDWHDLMGRNGGPKHAGKLVRKRGKKLRYAKPRSFVVPVPMAPEHLWVAGGAG